ncbi:Pyruvate/Phosphoenolpyruvate kinase-like domain-containing protein [Aspergillus spectabilis]
MVDHIVRECILAGVAGVQIHDTIFACRNTLAKIEIVSQEAFLDLVQAARNARTSLHREILIIIAHTGALETLGLDATIARLQRAVQHGADAVLVDGLRSIDWVNKVVVAVKPAPVIYCTDPTGSPLNLSSLAAFIQGFRMIIYPGLSQGTVLRAVRENMNYLRHYQPQPIASDYDVLHLMQLLGVRQLEPPN